MKKIIVILIATVLLTGCESETKILPGSQGDDRILTEVSTWNVIYSDTSDINQSIRFRTILEAGFPCYEFSHFKSTSDGGEVFITPMAYQSFRGCNYFESRMERIFIFEPENPGKYLIHFYQTDSTFYNFEINVVDSSQIN